MENNNTQLQKSSPQDFKASPTQFIVDMKPRIRDILPPGTFEAERFIMMLRALCRRTPKLLQCDKGTFEIAIMQVASLGLNLEPSAQLVHLIPRSNKGKMEVTVQVGYKGMLALAYRSGMVDRIETHPVYELDEFEMEYGLNPRLKHRPTNDDQGEFIGVYAVLKLKGCEPRFEYMSKSRVDHIRQTYTAESSKAWQNEYDEMARKTVLRLILKTAPFESDVEPPHYDTTATGVRVTAAEAPALPVSAARQTLPEHTPSQSTTGGADRLDQLLDFLEAENFTTDDLVVTLLKNGILKDGQSLTDLLPDVIEELWKNKDKLLKEVAEAINKPF